MHAGGSAEAAALRQRVTELGQLAEERAASSAAEPERARQPQELPGSAGDPDQAQQQGQVQQPASDEEPGQGESDKAQQQPRPGAEPDGAQQEAAHRLGEVVWAREKGWPAWPALVITFETTRDLAALRARSPQHCLFLAVP